MAFAKLTRAFNDLGEHLKSAPLAAAYRKSGWRGAGAGLWGDVREVASGVGLHFAQDTAQLKEAPSSALLALRHNRALMGAGVGAGVGAGSAYLGDRRHHSVAGRAAVGGLLGAAAGGLTQYGWRSANYSHLADAPGLIRKSWAA